MKKLVIILLVAFGIYHSAPAQPLSVVNLMNKYRGQDGVISVYLPGFVMKLAASVADLEKEERQLVRSIKSMRVLTIEDASRFRGVNFVDELRLNTERNGFVPLIEIHDSGQDVLIIGKEKNGKLKDLLVVVGGEDNVLVHIKGRLNTDMIGALADIADIDELRYTRQL